jgi:hypothetical protein
MLLIGPKTTTRTTGEGGGDGKKKELLSCWKNIEER